MPAFITAFHPSRLWQFGLIQSGSVSCHKLWKFAPAGGPSTVGSTFKGSSYATL
jgi:hypothetical protein